MEIRSLLDREFRSTSNEGNVGAYVWSICVCTLVRASNLNDAQALLNACLVQTGASDLLLMMIVSVARSTEGISVAVFDAQVACGRSSQNSIISKHVQTIQGIVQSS